MMYDKNDFIVFCKMYEKENEFIYSSDNLEETETGMKYSATFRDDANYKIGFELYLESGTISWEEPEFNDDELDTTKSFFNELIEQVFNEFDTLNPLTRMFSSDF
ncbi:hypothetical protein MZM54_00575 [[Brevibacterium] frigoritolerans]|nr:hypothetical protein [Peribacillus frigoritolerans]